MSSNDNQAVQDYMDMKEIIQVGKQRMSRAAYNKRKDNQVAKNKESFAVRKDLETNYPLIWDVLMRRHHGNESIDLYDYMLARDAEIADESKDGE